jgi:hypothetical protein
MHFMLVGAILHTTVLGVIAFFVLFAASRASGLVAMLGNLLGYWILLLAILGLIIGIGSVVTGKPMMGLMGDKPWMMHGGWHHMGPPQPAAEPAPSAAPAPAKPS